MFIYIADRKKCKQCSHICIYDREMRIGKCIVRNEEVCEFHDILTLSEYPGRGYFTSLLRCS